MIVRSPREFIALLLIIAAAISAPRSIHAQTLPDGVASGDIDQTSVILWARSTALGPITFQYSQNTEFRDAQSVETVVSDPTIPVKVELDGLIPGTPYNYQVTNSAGESASGYFQTPFQSGLHGLRFGVSGDWRGELAPYTAISNAADRQLNFFIALGDTIYADVPSIDLPQSQAHTLGEFRIKHNEVYRERFGLSYLADLRASTATYAMIDDHEVTNDFAGGAPAGSDPRFDVTGEFVNDSEFFNNGLQVFHEYNPIREEWYGDTGDPRTAGARKLYRYRTFGSDAAMILLDERSFRDEELNNILNPFANREIRQFVEDSFDPNRTMLGQVQFNQLTEDLFDAQSRGITWKFVVVPEPIQNLSPIQAADRFEGYAFERTRLIQFILDNGITNVVFIAADIHGTFINNVTYQLNPDDHQRTTNTFEITTGSVAYAAPFGPTVLQYIPFGGLARWISALYGRLTPVRQDRIFLRTANQLLRWFGYSPVGLQRTSIDADLTDGSYLAVNSFGWSEFEIDAQTQRLTVTTYGIPWYDQLDFANDTNEVLGRVPKVISQFNVDPLAGVEPSFDNQLRRPSPCGAFGMVGLLWPAGLAALLLVRPRARNTFSPLPPRKKQGEGFATRRQ